jgi:hypothetical protein
LDVETTDLREITRGGVVGGDELCHHGELLGRVDNLARSVERCVAHAVRVEVAAIFVADTRVALAGRVITAVGASAASLTVDGARVGRVSCRHFVGLENVHLSAASAVLSGASVLVVGRWRPALRVSLDRKKIGKSLNRARHIVHNVPRR